MTQHEVKDMLEKVEGMRQHLDTATHTIFCELETIKLKLNKILAEVLPPK